MALTILSVAYPFAPVGPDAVGGAEQVLAALDGALVAAGRRSIVVAQEFSKVAGRLLPLPAPAGAIDEAARAETHARLRALIAETLAREAVDLVHLHGIDCAAYVPSGVPALATLHLPLDWYPPALFRDFPNLALHAVSQTQHATRPDGARLLPPIPNGVPDALFSARARKRGYALLLGRICPEKGVHLGIEAAKRAGAPLLVGGRVFPYEAHERYFRESVAPLLDARRRFLGPVGFERKRRLLAGARCLLVPSLAAETASLVAMEALATGTPVIAFPNGALADVVEHGRTGWLVADAAEMAQAIARADAIDPDVCRMQARLRFSQGRMVGAYLDLYARLAGRGLGSAA